jgi:two-component system response regulator
MNASTDILLVEDDPGDVHLALAVFRALGIAERCVVVNDGEEALDFLHARARFAQRPPGLPRLILLDLKMPRMNGFELLQQIKADETLKVVPVVALTSSREERDVARAYDLRVNAYVVKSINFSEYRATLQALANYWGTVNAHLPGFVAPRSKLSAGRGQSAKRDNPGFWSLCPC